MAAESNIQCSNFFLTLQWANPHLFLHMFPVVSFYHSSFRRSINLFKFHSISLFKFHSISISISLFKFHSISISRSLFKFHTDLFTFYASHIQLLRISTPRFKLEFKLQINLGMPGSHQIPRCVPLSFSGCLALARLLPPISLLERRFYCAAVHF